MTWYVFITNDVQAFHPNFISVCIAFLRLILKIFHPDFIFLGKNLYIRNSDVIRNRVNNYEF